MMTEIKKKKTRFGAIIAFCDEQSISNGDLDHLKSLDFASAFTYIHKVGTSEGLGSGVNVIGYKTVPTAKQLIGHYITQFRGDGLVLFFNPKNRLLSNAEAVYSYADSNRWERSYAFWAGDGDSMVIAVNASLIEHIFHAIPEKLKATDNWIGWLDSWIKKFLFGGRYFDANAYIGMATKQEPVATPVEPTPSDESAPEPPKRGRKKSK